MFSRRATTSIRRSPAADTSSPFGGDAMCSMERSAEKVLLEIDL